MTLKTNKELQPFGSNIKFFLLIALVFIFSRIFFYLKGVRFDYSGLGWYWQYLDLNILQNDLLNGLFFQHSQPPLFNFFLGIVLKLFPNNFSLVFNFLYISCSLAIYYGLYRILWQLGISRWLSFFLASVYILSPTAILFENLLLYTWPIAALFIISANAILICGKRANFLAAGVFLLCITSICLMRSMYHLLFLIPCLFLLSAIPSFPRRKIISFSAIALIVVLSVFIKNYFVFGFFGTSSWTGMGLWKVAKDCEKVELSAAEKELTAIYPFRPLSFYPEKYRKVPSQFSQIKAVSAETKTNGAQNLNHYGYIPISRVYFKAALRAISNDVASYLVSVGQALCIYSTPSWSYIFLNYNRQKIQDYIDSVLLVKKRLLWERSIWNVDEKRKTPVSSNIILLLMHLLVFINFGIFFVRFFLLKTPVENPFLQIYTAFIVGYMFFVSNFFEVGENNRFFVMISPIFWLASIMSLKEIGTLLAKKIFVNSEIRQV